MEFDLLTLLSVESILAILIGALFGTLIGALPGLGATVAIVLLLPFTFAMDPLAAILLLLSAYQSAEYGGSISSIILGIPGTPAAAATVIDGYTMAKQSSPGKALAYSLLSSAVGGIIGGLGLLVLAVPMTTFALQISSTDMVLIALLGLTALTALTAQSKVKTWISVLLGLMMGTVGLDMFTSQSRFTGPWLELLDGFPIIVVMVGVFAFSEVMSSIMEGQMGAASQNKNMSTRLRLKEMRGIAKPTLLGSLIGTAVGVIPGMGAGPASWFAYSASKRISSKPQLFGKGSPEGIAGPEAANNATVGGALVPLMTLGVPGSPTTAVILGAFVIHGIVPGPKLFSSQPDLVAGIFVGFLVTTVAMYLVGRLLTPLFARSLKLPQKYLMPLVILFSLVGVYAAREVPFDVVVAALIGLGFFILRGLGYSLPAFVLAFVLTPMIEENFRRTLIVGDGIAGITQSPITMVLLVLVVVAALWPLISRLVPARKKKEPVLADR